MATLLSYSLCSIQDVKESLGLASSDSSKDSLIIRKINAATEMIENFLGRRILATDYTNIDYDATGIDQIILQQRPVTALSIFGIRNNTLNDDDFEEIDSQLYFLDSAAGVIDLNFNNVGHWNRYRFSYTAGYTTVPSDLAEACATLAAFLTENPAGTVGAVRSKEEGQRRIEYYDNSTHSSGGSADTALFRQLGIYGAITAYANEPILADK